MIVGFSQKFKWLFASVLLTGATVIPTGANSSASYGYDEVGRLRSALYDNGLCVAYAYDQVGNRTSQANTLNDAPEQAVWGSGSWGCFKWTAP
ncbi:MAG: RHS repeat protein [Nitrosospira sp.]|nr:RHS repeat protein [Nitrosospira sp.]